MKSVKEFNVGDIIFYETSTFIGSIIRFVTKIPFSHVALAVGPKNIIEANSFVRSRKLLFNETKYKRVKVMRYKTELTEKQKLELIENSHKLLGRKYDYWGIFLLFLRIVFRVKIDRLKDDYTKLWCSELVDYVYETIGIDLVPQLENNYVTIEDLEKSPVLYEAFQITEQQIV